MAEITDYLGAEGRLTAGDAAALSDQIASLTRAGLPLASGLVALGEELPRGRLRRSVYELARTLESGVPLEKAISHQQNRIPPHLRGLVIAGVRSGRLGDVLNRFTRYASIGIGLKRELWLSLAYPLVTSAAAVALFVFVCTFLVRQFERIYRDFNIPLPRLTIALVNVAGGVYKLAPPALVVAGVALGCWLAAQLWLSAATRRSLAARLPLFGTIWRTTSLAEFCHLLALLLESQLPLPEALRLAGAGVQDADIDSACQLMARDVEAGGSLAKAISNRRPFPLGLAQLLRWAERYKSLPEVLHVAGAMFEARARSHTALRRRSFQRHLRDCGAPHGLCRSGPVRAARHTDQPPFRLRSIFSGACRDD